jgi:hypothetical protein
VVQFVIAAHRPVMRAGVRRFFDRGLRVENAQTIRRGADFSCDRGAQRTGERQHIPFDRIGIKLSKRALLTSTNRKLS